MSAQVPDSPDGTQKRRRTRDAHKSLYKYDRVDDLSSLFMAPSGSSSSKTRPSGTAKTKASRGGQKTRGARGSFDIEPLQQDLEAIDADGDLDDHRGLDAPARRRRRQRRDDARRAFDRWHKQLPRLVLAYNQQPSLSELHRTSASMTCGCSEAGEESDLVVFDFSGTYKVRQATCADDMMHMFFQHRLFPATAGQPRAAFSLPLLRLFQALRKHSGVGAYNMANALWDVFRVEAPGIQLSDHARNQLGAASSWYQSTQAYAADAVLHDRKRWKEPRPPLCEDDLVLTIADLADSCPACFQTFLTKATRHPRAATAPSMPPSPSAAEDTGVGPADGARVIWGQDAHRGSQEDDNWAQEDDDAAQGADDDAAQEEDDDAAQEEDDAQRRDGDPSTSPPQLIVSLDGNFSQKRKKRRNVSSRQSLPSRRFLSQRQVDEAEKDLLLARISTGNTQHSCSAKVKAGDPGAAKGAMGPHDITGVMGLCCRHDIPLIFCDITSPGERHHYAIALLRCLFYTLGSSLQHVGVMYDIGCRFAPNNNVKAVLPKSVKITWTIPLFHVYGHTFACRVQYNPRRVAGMAWTDGEGMERVWSGVSTLVASARSMSQVSRRFHLEERLQHLVEMRRRTLARWIAVKKARIDAVQLESLAILGRPEADSTLLSSRIDHAALAEAQGKSRPRHFPRMKEELFRTLCYMSDERQRQAHIRTERMVDTSGGDQVPPSSAQAATDSDVDDEERIREPDPDKRCDRGVAEVAVLSGTAKKRKRSAPAAPDDGDAESATKRLADGLFVALAQYHLTSAQLRDRKGQRYATEIIGQLNVALGKEKKNAIAAADALQKHLKTRFPKYVPIKASHLFEEWVRDWASTVSTEGTIDLPWWADRDVIRIVDAFDHLFRVAEERARLKIERTNIRKWVKSRIKLLQRRSKGDYLPNVAARLLEQHQALKAYWISAAKTKDDMVHVAVRAPEEASTSARSLRPLVSVSDAVNDGEEDAGLGSHEEDTDTDTDTDEEGSPRPSPHFTPCATDATTALMRDVDDEAFGWTSTMGEGDESVERSKLDRV
ncbi:hypothetical protein OC835_001460 [Tilletia horrida]|nr:hypothetical protein OC835_001460 [Tilletia horrida]